MLACSFKKIHNAKLLRVQTKPCCVGKYRLCDHSILIGSNLSWYEYCKTNYELRKYPTRNKHTTINQLSWLAAKVKLITCKIGIRSPPTLFSGVGRIVEVVISMEAMDASTKANSLPSSSVQLQPRERIYITRWSRLFLEHERCIPSKGSYKNWQIMTGFLRHGRWRRDSKLLQLRICIIEGKNIVAIMSSKPGSFAHFNSFNF